MKVYQGHDLYTGRPTLCMEAELDFFDDMGRRYYYERDSRNPAKQAENARKASEILEHIAVLAELDRLEMENSRDYAEYQRLKEKFEPTPLPKIEWPDFSKPWEKPRL